MDPKKVLDWIKDLKLVDIQNSLETDPAKNLISSLDVGTFIDGPLWQSWPIPPLLPMAIEAKAPLPRISRD